MRRIGTAVAAPSADQLAMIFFTQCLDELLFDHTYDSYQSPALNTHLRLIELSRIADRLNDTPFFSGTIPPFVKELDESIGSDEVLDSNKKLRLHKQISLLDVSRPVEFISIVEGMKLEFDDYPYDLRNEVIAAILDGKNRRSELRALAESLIVELDYERYSRRHIYYVTQRLIERLIATPAFDSRAHILWFLEQFPVDIEMEDFHVSFKSNVGFLRFAEEAAPYGISMNDDAPPLPFATDEAGEWCELQPMEIYLHLPKIPAYDPVWAKRMAEVRLQVFRASIDYVMHRDEGAISGDAVVSSQRFFASVIRAAPDPMQCGVSREEKPLVGTVGEILTGKHLDQNATYRIQNALRYHHAALHAEHPENQVLDLWAALEGLLLGPHSTKPRIVQITEALMPSLLLTYVDELFAEVGKCVEHDGAARDYFAQIEYPGLIRQKVAAYCVCTEFDQRRKEFPNLIASTNPLLLYRTFELYKKFSSPKATLRTLRKHAQKIEWHLNRIYATRNAIVHTADSMPYLSLVVRHLHTYLDTCIKVITDVAVDSTHRRSLTDITRYLSSLSDFRLSQLEAMKERQCTNETLVRVLVGVDNPVTQFV